AGELHLTQQRFILDDPAAAPLRWAVPITYAALDQLDRPSSVLLTEESTTVPWSAERGPFKLNVGDTGFYRVLYDESSRAALVAALPALSEADQLNLLGDTWALVLAGHSSATDYLDLVQALRDSTSQPVWASMLVNLGTLDRWQID